MRHDDLLHQLASLATHLAPVLPPTSTMRRLDRVVRHRPGCLRRRGSVGRRTPRRGRSDLSPPPARGLIRSSATVLPVSHGVAGYVALSGQSLSVDRATDGSPICPRCGRAERIRAHVAARRAGLHSLAAGVIGVLSVLDRSLAPVSTRWCSRPRSPINSAICCRPLTRWAGPRSCCSTRSPMPSRRRMHSSRPRSAERWPDCPTRMPNSPASLRHSVSCARPDDATRARVHLLLTEIVALATAKRRR